MSIAVRYADDGWKSEEATITRRATICSHSAVATKDRTQNQTFWSFARGTTRNSIISFGVLTRAHEL